MYHKQLHSIRNNSVTETPEEKNSGKNFIHAFYSPISYPKRYQSALEILKEPPLAHPTPLSVWPEVAYVRSGKETNEYP